MPDKASFLCAQMSEKWLELFLKKFPSCIFRNNIESDSDFYLQKSASEADLVIAC